MITRDELTGLILAGGQGRRMGGRDKGLEPFLGRPLVAHVRDRLAGRVVEVLINANRNAEAYAPFSDRVIVDAEGGFQGPLMGIYSGLRAATTPWLLVVPCDSPALPRDLVDRMVARLAASDGQHQGEGDIAVAFDGERLHPVVALIRTALVDDLAMALAAGERKIDRWYARHAWCRVDVSDCPDAFANLNSDDEKQRLERVLSEAPSAAKQRSPQVASD
ncbi:MULTISPECIES: molybdenum cofactor guanylyltransferase MobA [Halomonas]|uniref:Molybdenum cofactor guanylyltransferase n=1 Tax=Halomonas ventosae TaxID=229007 RepID=A0A4R6I5H1_9GAMM|nr:molybdenum cofactor guanylyltransferase MobA [Halomonas ventosae]TDO16734.1 molybdenum cofactor guanylyltransferase [Halomonas ventosae]